MMKIIFCILLICSLTYADTGVYRVWVGSFTLTQLKTFRTLIIDKVKDCKQPVERFRCKVNVSTNTDPTGIVHSNNIKDIVIDGESKEALLAADKRIENISQFENAINNNKIDIIGYYTYNRQGFIRNSDFNNIKEAHRDFRERYRYEVYVSTP